MFIPKNFKYTKYFKAKPKGFNYKSKFLAFGNYGIKSLTCGKLSSKQIETLRRVLSKNLKKLGVFWIRIFPNTPVTKKPVEVRMGKGKGNVYYWISPIRKGQMLFEMEGISSEKAKDVFKKCQQKLGLKVKFVK